MQASPLKPLENGLLVCGVLLALCLLGWRASVILSPAPSGIDPASASQIELRVTDTLQTILGQGEAFARQSVRPDGARAWFVLINETATLQAAFADEEIVDLVSSVVFIDTLDGDSVTVRRLAFAAPAGPTLASAQFAEFAGLAMLSLILLLRLGLGLLSGDRPGVAGNIPASPQATSSRVARADPRAQLVARRISEDPARAAEIIRRWLRQEMAEA